MAPTVNRLHKKRRRFISLGDSFIHFNLSFSDTPTLPIEFADGQIFQYRFCSFFSVLPLPKQTPYWKSSGLEPVTSVLIPVRSECRCKPHFLSSSTAVATGFVQAPAALLQQ